MAFEHIAHFFDEEGSLNDWHDPIHWVDHKTLKSLERDLRDKKEFVLETNNDSNSYIFCLLNHTFFIEEFSVLVSGNEFFYVTNIGDNKLKYQLLEPEHERSIIVREFLADPEVLAEYESTTTTPHDFLGSVDKVIMHDGRVLTDDELIERSDAYYNEEDSLWHVPIFIANTDFRFDQYGMEIREDAFLAPYRCLDDDGEDIAHFLGIEPGHKIEVYAIAKDCWRMYNRNTNEVVTLPPITTSIGADDGHYRFILGCTAAFSYIPNVTFSIPAKFEYKLNAIKCIKNHCLYK